LLSGVQCSAVLVIEQLGFFCRTSPIHLHQHLVMMAPMSSCLHLWSIKSSLVNIYAGQNILSIWQRHVIWKDHNLERSVSVILQCSDPYRRIYTTQLWYTCIASAWCLCCNG
jgi:hypothetical protein